MTARTTLCKPSPRLEREPQRVVRLPGEHALRCDDSDRLTVAGGERLP